MPRIRIYHLIVPLLLIAGIIYSAMSGSYTVYTRLADGSLYNNEMQLHFRIYNYSGSALDLRTCKLYYRFSDAAAINALSADVWWFSAGGTSDVQVTFASLGREDRRFALAFQEGWVEAGGYAEIQMRVRKADWSNFNESDDLSAPTSAKWAENSLVELVVNGVSEWGDAGLNDADSSVTSSSSEGSNLSSSSGSAYSQTPVDPLALSDMLRSVNDFSVWGTEGVWLADRTTGYYEGVELYGSVGTNAYAEMGADSRIIGGLYAHDSVFLRERAYLDGDLRVGLGYGAQNAVIIRGTVSTASPGPLWNLPGVIDLEASLGTSDVIVPVDGEQALEPGAYNNLQVYSRSTLHLVSGTYRFRNFRLEPDVTLDLNVADGPIVIQVLESVNFADRTRMSWVNNNFNPLAFQIYQQGSTDFSIGTDQTLAGRFIAPNARVRVASRVKLAGWLQGKSIQIEPDTKLCEPPTLEGFTHSEVAYGPGFDALQTQYQAVVETSVSLLNVYAKAKGTDASVTINGEVSGTEFSIPSSGRSLSLRVYSAERAAIMPWCAETRYTLAVKPAANAVVRVKASAACTGSACDGSSWDNAFKTLTPALEVARSQGKTIQIAEGRYTLQGSRSATYLLGSGMDVRGGFVGIAGETLENRRGDINKTILSGDVSEDDGELWPPNSRTPTTTADNAYHVVTLLGGHGLPDAERLDRVSIEGGMADGSGVASLGAGILAVGASPTLEYLIVRHNQAHNAGGALYAYRNDSLLIGNSYIVENQSLGKGGALAIEQSHVALTNDIIAQNEAPIASAIFANETSISANFITIADNISTTGPGIVFAKSTMASMLNTIVWGNHKTEGDVTNVLIDNANADWSHCDLQGKILNGLWNVAYGNDMGDNLFVNPLFQSSAIANKDGLFFSKDDGYTLSDNSPLIDKGETRPSVTQDLFNVDRTISKNGSNLPDIGAREWFPNIANSFRFLKQTALGELQAVLNPAILAESVSPYFPAKLRNSPYAYVLSVQVPKNDYMEDHHSATMKVLNPDGSVCGESKKMTFYRIGETNGVVEYRTYRNGQGLFVFLSQKEMPPLSWYQVIKICDSDFRIEVEVK